MALVGATEREMAANVCSAMILNGIVRAGPGTFLWRENGCIYMVVIQTEYLKKVKIHSRNYTHVEIIMLLCAVVETWMISPRFVES